jgi:DHA3 family tetracycline resistance protein-like MFS transporter
MEGGMGPGNALGGRVRFARALGSRPFALLWLGQTISVLGDGVYIVALAWQVQVLTGSATDLALILLAASVPRLLFLLLGGVLADRLPRRGIMLFADAGRGVAVLALATLSYLQLLQLWHLAALSLLFGFASAFFIPAYQSISPQLVEVEALPSANALTGLSRQLSGLVGPALGAALVTVARPAGAFAFDGLTFLFSAFCLLSMRVPSGARAAAPADRPGSRRRGVIGDFREGLSYVAGSSWIWVTILIASAGNAAWQPLSVSTPKLVQDVYHTGVWLFGALFTAEALGSIVATVIVGQLRRLRHRGVVAYLALAVSSVAMMAFALPGLSLVVPTAGLVGRDLALRVPLAAAPAIALGAAALVGFGLGTFTIIWETVLQELIPADKLGRVSSLDWFGSLAFQPAGLVLAGVLTDALGAGRVFLVCGGLNLALNLIGLSVRGIRALD